MPEFIPEDNPGWMKEIFDSVEKEVATWPKWKIDGVESIRIKGMDLTFEIDGVLYTFKNCRYIPSKEEKLQEGEYSAKVTIKYQE